MPASFVGPPRLERNEKSRSDTRGGPRPENVRPVAPRTSAPRSDDQVDQLGVFFSGKGSGKRGSADSMKTSGATDCIVRFHRIPGTPETKLIGTHRALCRLERHEEISTRLADLRELGH